MRFITLTGARTENNVHVRTDQIRSLEPQVFEDGTTITHVVFISNDHDCVIVKESCDEILARINNQLN